MRKYILNRIIRSIFSIIVVMGIVFLLIYGLIPRENIFNTDTNIVKYTGDNKIDYINKQYERYGYIDYVELNEYCIKVFPDKTSTDYFNCNKRSTITSPNPYVADFTQFYVDKGYEVETFSSTGKPYAIMEVSPVKMMISWFANLIEFDNINTIQDPDNPDLERKIYIGTDWNNVPAIMCSGCENKYLVYFDGAFPFIHFNFIKLNLGVSFPKYTNIQVTDVISTRQGDDVFSTITFPGGTVAESTILEHTCRYKSVLNSLERQDFTDNYAECSSNKSLMSMLGISFTIGIISSVLAYLLGVPLGMYMARHKNKIIDKIGIGYIVFITSVPSLAYIFMFSRIGSNLFKLPLQFPPGTSWQNYALPIISLALPSMAGLMMWIRRYMIDQTNSDYVRFARSKGLSEREIFSRHILKNASIPLIHGIPLAIVGTLVGAIITERVYAVPGMGKMLTDAIQLYNNGMIVGLTFIFTALSVLALLLGDILITIIDPRISFGEGGGRK